jgi:hypothetical protein
MSLKLSLPRELRVFLCHASEDKPRVRGYYRRLLDDGFKPWLDAESLLPGQAWEEEIPAAVGDSDVVIVFLSERSVAKIGFFNKEVTLALDVADRQPGGAIFIIPAKLEECEIPRRLARWHCVELFADEGYEKLKRSLERRADSIRSQGVRRDPPASPPTEARPSDARAGNAETKAEGRAEGRRPRRRRLSAGVKALAAVTLSLAVVYAALLYRNWGALLGEGGRPDAVGQGAAGADARAAFQESLVEIKNSNFAAAYEKLQVVSTAEGGGQLAHQAAYLKTFIALSSASAHLDMAESSRRALDRTKEEAFRELGVRQMLKAFYWADQLASSLDLLVSYDLPHVALDGVELQNPTTASFAEGLQASSRTEGGVRPSELQLQLAQAALSATHFRFHLVRALKPDFSNNDLMTQDVWRGSIRLTLALVKDIYELINKVSQRGIEFFSRTSERQLAERGLSAEKLGLTKALNVDYFRNLLQSLQRFLDAARSRGPATDAGDLSRMAEGVRQQLKSVNERFPERR